MALDHSHAYLGRYSNTGLAVMQMRVAGMVCLLIWAATCSTSRTNSGTYMDLGLADHADTVAHDLHLANCSGGVRRCAADDYCRPTQTCQSGFCCSGELDPTSCVCHCNGGAPCEPTNQACCEGDPKHWPPLPDVGQLKCRSILDCTPQHVFR